MKNYIYATVGYLKAPKHELEAVLTNRTQDWSWFIFFTVVGFNILHFVFFAIVSSPNSLESLLSFIWYFVIIYVANVWGNTLGLKASLKTDRIVFLYSIIPSMIVTILGFPLVILGVMFSLSALLKIRMYLDIAYWINVIYFIIGISLAHQIDYVKSFFVFVLTTLSILIPSVGFIIIFLAMT